MQSNSQYVWHKAYSWRKRLGEAGAGDSYLVAEDRYCEITWAE